MMRLSTPVLVPIVLGLPLASTAVAGTSNSSAPRIQVGQPFPDLSFPALADGKLTSMSAFRGKKTIVHVFASW